MSRGAGVGDGGTPLGERSEASGTVHDTVGDVEGRERGGNDNRAGCVITAGEV